MSQEVFVNQKKVVDFDDVIASALISANTTGTKLTFSKNNAAFLVTRTGRRARLVHVGNAVDAGGETSLTFHVHVNGSRVSVPPYDSFQQAMGLTYDGYSRIAVPIELPQGALIEVVVDNSAAGTDYNAFARVRIEYEDF